jgi:hypothetical protein
MNLIFVHEHDEPRIGEHLLRLVQATMASRKVRVCRLVSYGKYVGTLEQLEAAPDCLQCAANREILEHVWQVVANEYYDPHGKFSQADWAGVLRKTLQGNGGEHFTTWPSAVSTALWYWQWYQRTQRAARGVEHWPRPCVVQAR